MNKMLLTTLLLGSLLGSLCAARAALLPCEEFVGPLPGWKNVKTDFGAVGDGKADDTAAIKAGLNALAVWGKGKPGDPQVLYFPAGTYRTTESLNYENRLGIQIQGEDSSKTTIRYDGPAGQPILHCNGVSYSKFGRITWDGQGKASACIAHQWVPKGGFPAVTHMEHADEVFSNAGKGIIGGLAYPIKNAAGEIVAYDHGMDAETLVKRCKFLNDGAGLSIESFNALDWWLWDCEFTNCGVGATNCSPDCYGGGHFHVYHSVFRGSKASDIRIGHASYFGVRFNTSIGSRRFVEAIRPAGFKTSRSWGEWSDTDTWAAQIALQGNTIIDPLDPTPVSLKQHGPLVLLDNTFIVKPVGDAPVVLVAPPTDGAQCISMGNRFFGTSTVTVRGELTQQDNQTMAYQAAKAADRALPQLSPAAPPTHRKVFALTAASTTAEIQQAIDDAAKLNGQRPVIYLPAGRYAVGNTLHIPANCDVQIVGDGENSVLTWVGDNGGTLMHIAGPSQATLRDFIIVGIWNSKGAKLGKGIVAENLDQAGGQILFDQVGAENCLSFGMLFDGLRQTRVETRGSGSGGTSNGSGLIVDGGGSTDGPGVGFFGGAAGNNKESYVVRRGGNLAVFDSWYETNTEPRFIHLTDTGNLTLFNVTIATLQRDPAMRPPYSIDLDGFRGKLTIIDAGMNTSNPQVRLAGAGEGMKVLALGMNFSTPLPYFTNETKQAQFALFDCKQSQPNGAKPIADAATLTPAFLKEMLAQARAVVPSDWQPARKGATDLRLDRVSVKYQVDQGISMHAGAAN